MLDSLFDFWLDRFYCICSNFFHAIIDTRITATTIVWLIFPHHHTYNKFDCLSTWVLWVIHFCRSIRASHVLVSETGRVLLTGLRNCYTLQMYGLKENKCWHFPTNSAKALNYYSPEVLSQVCENIGCIYCPWCKVSPVLSYLDGSAGRWAVPWYTLPW